MRSSARYRLSVKFLRFRVTIALQLQIDFRYPRVDAAVSADVVARLSKSVPGLYRSPTSRQLMPPLQENEGIIP